MREGTPPGHTVFRITTRLAQTCFGAISQDMRFRPMFLLAGVLAACGGGTDAPVPASLELVSGDGQQGPRSATLAQPVIVRVLAADGSPFAGAVVTFTYASSSAVAGVDTSDAAGLAQFLWLLQSPLGTQTVHVTVAGVTGFDVTATALDPCVFNATYTFGATVNGSLAAGDCVDQGAFIDYYGFTAPNGSSSSIFTNTAATFDAFLQIEDPLRNIVAVNDDDPTGVAGLNSNIRVFLVSGASYRLGPSSFLVATSGNYTAASAAGTADVTNCVEVWAALGVTLSQTVAATDCASGGFLSDQFLVVLPANTAGTMRLSSTAFDAYLSTFDLFNNVVLDDDNSGGGTDARLVFTAAPVARLFLVDLGTATAGPTGAYSFVFVSGTNGAPPATATASTSEQAEQLRAQLRNARTARSALAQRLHRRIR